MTKRHRCNKGTPQCPRAEYHASAEKKITQRRGFTDGRTFPRCYDVTHMPGANADILLRTANAVLAAASLTVAALIVVAITRRTSRNLEPLGLAFLAVFLIVELRATVLAVVGVPASSEHVSLYLTVDAF